MNFIASSPSLELSGANVLLARLFSGFIEAGHPADWWVTSHQPGADCQWLTGLGLKFGSIPATPVGAVGRRQRILIEAIRASCPCVYFPNFDFDMLWAVPAMPLDCRTVFIVHCDDPVYYEAIEARGEVMDAIVCVSRLLAERARQRWPKLRDRIHHIPFGVAVPAVGESPSRHAPVIGTLEVVYCGRLAQEQKRIGDLAEVILACHAQGLPIRFHIAGTGPDEVDFFTRVEGPMKAGNVIRHGLLANDQVSALLRRCHVFILTSAYEGLPVSLLEAMAVGCVPVVTAVASGIPEVVTDGVEGFIHPIGDVQSIVARLAELAAFPSKLAIHSPRALERVLCGGYTRENCVRRYLELCENLIRNPKHGPVEKNPKSPPNYRLMQRLRLRLLRNRSTKSSA